jgi:hypothetical protein
MPNHERYIPALGLGILTPLFDPFLCFSSPVSMMCADQHSL